MWDLPLKGNLFMTKISYPEAEALIAEYVTYPLNSTQLDALATFVANVGETGILRQAGCSLSNVVVALNEGRLDAAAVYMLDYSYSDQHDPTTGHWIRIQAELRNRLLEAAQFLTGV